MCYMNGYLVGSGIANRNAIDYVNRLDIHSGTGDKMEFSIDDVKVYKGSKIPAEENVPTPRACSCSMFLRSWDCRMR